MTKQLLNLNVIYYHAVYPIRSYIYYNNHIKDIHISCYLSSYIIHITCIDIYIHLSSHIQIHTSSYVWTLLSVFYSICLMFISLFTFHIYPCLSLPLYDVQLITLMHNYIYFSMIIHIFLIPINLFKHYVQILSFTLSAFNTLYKSMLKHVQTHFITYLIPLIHIIPYISKLMWLVIMNMH